MKKKDFFAKWDGKCSICEKPVAKKDCFSDGRPDMVNGAMIGNYIEVYGHPTCVHNVDKKIVMPNRGRFMALQAKLKGGE